MLVVGHTPKRDFTKILTSSDLAGSKQLTNLVDTLIALNKLPKDDNLRYLKHVKCRDGVSSNGTKNVALFTIAKRYDGFLRLVFDGHGNEFDLLNIETEKKQSAVLKNAIDFLKEYLADGKEHRSTECQEKAKEHNISYQKFNEAKAELGVVVESYGTYWTMRLPSAPVQNEGGAA